MSLLVPDHVWAILTIWQEARGEVQDGRVAVAEVIRNRTKQKYSSDGTVAGTCLWPMQFSGWLSKDPNRIKSVKIELEDAIVKDCYAAWDEAVAGSNRAHGAVLYYAPHAVDKTPEWVANCTEVAVIGRHVFFTPK